MALEIKQTLRLSQQLVMTPQLQQAIKLLQLSRMELQDLVQNELLENPMLEETEETREEEQKLDNEEKLDDQRDVERKASTESAGEPEPKGKDEFDWEAYAESYISTSTSQSIRPPEDLPTYEQTLTKGESLTDHLLWQLRLVEANDVTKRVAMNIIGNLNDDGYLTTPLEGIAAQENVALEEAELALILVQGFDPPGIAARDLKECLLIQLELLRVDDDKIVELIENHLPNLERKNYPAIAKAMGLTIEEIIELTKIIHELEPKPGRAYTDQEPQYITPDIFIRKVGDQWVVSLNEDGLPKLKISHLYRQLLKGGGSSLTKEYVQEKLRSAIWLIRSIHQRQLTIYKVTESIVKHQKEFFDKGISFLRPMILRDVANDISMHESTVSRVTTNKYVHTPRGIFELKYFFNSGIQRIEGGEVASESVKARIKEIVGLEDPKKPLSDQQLVDQLRENNIQIARRTVAKYREMLQILPSSKRKKLW
ncbi:MAG: RNA polymerase sigma-54 factor [Deltaproteobacteria bacterium RIFCSPHIGHO2_12_FULL_43_9]|nr:MAG: RNA polymerase sigma-54 factor [Deltaproteobacteria bacterium RIFCSPHIGHO2_12_FULL_43_9]